MSAFANKARRFLIRFGKVAPFIICFIVLLSDLENIYAIIAHNTIVCGGIEIYNTPISFAIGNNVEYDAFLLFVIALISFSIEACVYNIAVTFYLFLLLYRRHYLFQHETFDDSVYLAIMSICVIISSYFIYKGIKILLH